jgi:hypothetical protein
MKTKSFDCVQMKHEAQERIRKELENLTREQELEYWQKIAEEAMARRETNRREDEAANPAGVP